MAEDGFRLPGSSYEVLSQIIRAYGRGGSEADRTHLAQMLGIAASEISRNAGFLTSVGILEDAPGRRKSVTPLGRRLANSIDHSIEPEVESVWREIVTGNEFLSRLVTAVEVRNGMEPESLSSHIAFSAGQPKSPKTMTGARTIAGVLERARVIKLQDGKYVPVRRLASAEALVEGSRPPPTMREEPRDRVSTVLSSWRSGATSTAGIAGSQSPLVVQVQIQVRVEPKDLSELADQLRDFVRRLEDESDGEPVGSNRPTSDTQD